MVGLIGDPCIREPPLLCSRRPVGLWLIKMQGTGWQTAAAAYRQYQAEKG